MKKNIKLASLVTSIIAIVVTFTMLIGTTFAWFTDSATSSGNKIQAGTLKIDLELLDTQKGWISLKNESMPLFDCDTWEPGYTDVKVLKVENEGSLALQWKAKFVSEKQLSALAEVIDVYVLPSEQELAYPTSRDLDGYTLVGTVADFVNTIETTTNGILLAGEEAYLGIALKMRTTAGNEYQGLDLGGVFDIVIVATQVTLEQDGFNDNYDNGAKYPEVDTNNHVSGSTEDLVLKAGDVTVTIPAEAQSGAYKLEVSNKIVKDNAVSLNISLFNGADKASGSTYSVAIQLDSNQLKEIESLMHNGNEITNYTYNPLTGVLTFETQEFSPFVIEYKDLNAENVEIKNGKIVAGTFVGKNPADIDASLKEADSEYIAIDYEKDGETYYVVAERAITTVVSAGEATMANDNYVVKTNQSGKLYSLISGLKDNEYSVVYLLPGTYNEATTIYVSSSMEIIGLGNKEDIKVVKLSSSDSNRHLFNANGTKADYIEVTISNMTLDATAKSTGGKDNAVVQSIRKSKVKCYNLDIIKGSGWDAVAFYVNGNNAVDGVKYTAYLYAEDCNLNTTQAFCVVSTNGTYKFYHSGLTYGGKEYTTNSGSNKNIKMEPNDWDWEN